MRDRRFIIASATLLVATFMFRSKLGGEEEGRGAEDVDRLGERIDHLERSQHQAEVRQAVRTTHVARYDLARAGTESTDGVDETSTAADGMAMLDGAQLAEAQIAADRTHFDQLARELSTEPIDATWADETSRGLTASFQTVALAAVGRLAKVECRQSRCSIDVEHSKPNLTPQLVEWLQQQSCGFHVQGDAGDDPASPRVQRIYLDCDARRG